MYRNVISKFHGPLFMGTTVSSACPNNLPSWFVGSRSSCVKINQTSPAFSGTVSFDILVQTIFLEDFHQKADRWPVNGHRGNFT